MACPICDQKPANCDCTDAEKRQYVENCELEDELSELRAAVRALLDGVNAKYPDKKPREWTCQHMAELDRLVPPQGDGKQ